MAYERYDPYYDDDVQAQDPYASAPPQDPQTTAQDPMTNPNQPPTYALPPGQSWYWNETAGRWSVNTGSTGGNKPGYQDLAYWKSQGVPETDIYDSTTGQLKPGWRRTGNGYERDTTTVVDKEPPPSGGTTSYASSAYESPTGFEWPEYAAPNYIDPGAFDAGPAFTFKDFVAPNAETMQNDPGFQFRLDQGRKALESSAAGKGVLRSGGTLKDILGYGQNFASQEFGNVYNRALQEYDTNRGNASDIWGKQYGQRKDVYGAKAENAGKQNTFNLNNAQFGWNAKYGPASQQFDDLFRRWAKEGDWLTNIATAGAD